jgi:hypothetical protein
MLARNILLKSSLCIIHHTFIFRAELAPEAPSEKPQIVLQASRVPMATSKSLHKHAFLEKHTKVKRVNWNYTFRPELLIDRIPLAVVIVWLEYLIMTAFV